MYFIAEDQEHYDTLSDSMSDEPEYPHPHTDW